MISIICWTLGAALHTYGFIVTGFHPQNTPEIVSLIVELYMLIVVFLFMREIRFKVEGEFRIQYLRQTL
jgi:hypothetical protein